MPRPAVACLLLLAAIAAATACESRQPATRAGEALDRAGTRTGDALGRAADSTGAALGRAGSWVRDRTR